MATKFFNDNKYPIAAASGALFGGALYGASYWLIPATIGAINFFIASSLTPAVGTTAAVFLSYAIPALLAVLAGALIAMAIAALISNLSPAQEQENANQDMLANGDELTSNHGTHATSPLSKR